jgi:hypothetical protein
MKSTSRVSVIVPVVQRPEPLEGLYREYAAPLAEAGSDFEFVFVLDPSLERWWEGQRGLLEPLRSAGAPIRVLQLAQVAGEAELVRAGAAEARHPILLILPAWRRVEAAGLPRLVDCVLEGADVAVAVRSPRRDPWPSRLRSRLFRFLARPVTRRFRDLGSGVVAILAEVLRDVPPYGGSYRYLPVLAEREGFRVEEVELPQHPADTGARAARPGAYLERGIDLLGLFFLVRFTHRPLRFFGLLGALLGTAGVFLLLVLLIQRLGGQGIANRPALLLGTLLVVFGTQSIALGLVAEIIVHLTAPQHRSYRLARPERKGGDSAPESGDA